MRTAREAARSDSMHAESDRVQREDFSELTRVDSELGEKRSRRLLALLVGGYAIAGLWMMSLTLAMLAVERNTRGARLGPAGTIVKPSGA